MRQGDRQRAHRDLPEPLIDTSQGAAQTIGFAHESGDKNIAAALKFFTHRFH